MGPGTTTRGVHFTPEELARDVCRRVLGGGAPPPLLDPACGEGALLIAAWRIGRARGLDPAGLHGIEIGEALVRRARQNLRAEIGGADGERAARNIVHADALGQDTPWPAATAIVANPPWVSFSGRQAAGRIARPQGEPPRGWPSLHGAFLERIAQHVGEQRTCAAVLLPSSLCELDRYAPARARVTSHATLRRAPVELGEDAFPGVTEPAVLLELEPGGAGSDAAAWEVERRESGRWTERLRECPRLPPEVFGDIGVHSGNCAATLVVDDGPNLPGLPGLREGRDLTAYRLGAPRRRLNVHLERSDGRRFRYAPLERYRAVAVLLRQTATRPIAALHLEPTYFRNSLLACRPPEELDPAFVVGVLNSGVLGEWHRERFLDARQRSFPQVKIAHLRSAPFPILRRADAPELHDRVARTVRELSGRELSGRPSGAAFERDRRRLETWIGEAYGVR